MSLSLTLSFCILSFGPAYLRPLISKVRIVVEPLSDASKKSPSASSRPLQEYYFTVPETKGVDSELSCGVFTRYPLTLTKGGGVNTVPNRSNVSAEVIFSNGERVYCGCRRVGETCSQGTRVVLPSSTSDGVADESALKPSFWLKLGALDEGKVLQLCFRRQESPQRVALWKRETSVQKEERKEEAGTTKRPLIQVIGDETEEEGEEDKGHADKSESSAGILQWYAVSSAFLSIAAAGAGHLQKTVS